MGSQLTAVSYHGGPDSCAPVGVMASHHLLLTLFPVIWKEKKGQVTLGFPTMPRQFGLLPAFHGTGEENLAAEGSEYRNILLGRALLFPKPGEPRFEGGETRHHGG